MPPKIIIPSYVNEEDFKLLAKCSTNVFEFARQVFIRHPVRGRVRFDLYPYQKRVLWYFLTKRFNIVLKFRQAGLTELIALFCLWLALYHPNKNIVIISIKDRVAKRVLARIKYIYKNLPLVLQTPLVNGRPGDYGTATELEFSNGSLITSIPTTEDAGRSEAVSLLVVDEAAIVRWANQIWAAAFPTLSTGGSSILNSCVTGDTEIIGEYGNFRIDSICPSEFGKKDISNLGIKVLSHTGKWQRVLGTVNKGKLETWEITNRFGDTLKCTPNHRLLTSAGWFTVKDIIEKNKYTITYDTGILKNTRVKGVQISKLTLVRKYIDTIYDLCVEEDESYITSSRFVNHNTPYGVGNWFHSMWVDAVSGGSEFNAIRLRWDMHPERDQRWYDSMRAVLGPKRTAQEIDGDFLSSGDTVFDLADIRDIEDQLDSWEVKRQLNGALLTFKPPKRNTPFFIGADVASGRSRDYSSFTIMDRYGEEYACFKGKIPPDRFADLLMQQGEKYNYATLAPEGNDIGLSTVHRIQNEGYPKLYYTVQLLKEKGETKPKEEKVPGWLTTSKNRLPIIDELETDIRQGELIIKDPFFVNEAYTFIYDERNRPVAMGKENRNRKANDDGLEEGLYTDDSIMGKAITNFVRKGKYNSVIVAPQ